MTKSKMFPCLPEEKSWKNPFWSFTVNDGVFSWLKGERPIHSRPRFFNFTRRPTTSETGSRARNSSRNCGGKRMRADRFAVFEYTTGAVRAGAERLSPCYSHARFSLPGGEGGEYRRSEPGAVKWSCDLSDEEPLPGSRDCVAGATLPCGKG